MTRRQLVWRGLEEWLAEECEVSLDSDFVSELELDDDGLVTRYPRMSELVPSGARA